MTTVTILLAILGLFSIVTGIINFLTHVPKGQQLQVGGLLASGIVLLIVIALHISVKEASKSEDTYLCIASRENRIALRTLLAHEQVEVELDKDLLPASSIAAAENLISKPVEC